MTPLNIPASCTVPISNIVALPIIPKAKTNEIAPLSNDFPTHRKINEIKNISIISE